MGFSNLFLNKENSKTIPEKKYFKQFKFTLICFKSWVIKLEGMLLNYHIWKIFMRFFFLK